MLPKLPTLLPTACQPQTFRCPPWTARKLPRKKTPSCTRSGAPCWLPPYHAQRNDSRLRHVPTDSFISFLRSKRKPKSDETRIPPAPVNRRPGVFLYRRRKILRHKTPPPVTGRPPRACSQAAEKLEAFCAESVDASEVTRISMKPWLPSRARWLFAPRLANVRAAKEASGRNGG